MRGKQPKRRPIKPDQKFSSELVTLIINYIMEDGKKRTAEKIVYTAMADLKGEKEVNEKTVKLKPLEVLETAIDNIQPQLEIRSRRVGGANYQVPIPVPPSRQRALAIKWLVQAARDARKTTTFAKAFEGEILNALNLTGTAMKKKEDTVRMAEANKAFAQFA